MAFCYDELKRHIGHEIVCVPYGDKDNPHNVAVECLDCNEIILSYDRGESMYSDTVSEDIEAVLDSMDIELTPDQFAEVKRRVMNYDYSDYNNFIQDCVENLLQELIKEEV